MKLNLILIAIILAILLMPVHPTFALKKYFNCMTEIADKNHNLTIDDVHACYYKEFHNPPK